VVKAAHPKAQGDLAGMEQSGNLGHLMMLAQEQDHVGALADPTNFSPSHALQFLFFVGSRLANIEHETPPAPAYLLACKSARYFLLPT